MKKLIKTLAGNKLKLFLLLLAVFFLFVGINCNDSLNSQSSDDPFGTGIIVINPIPAALFGNAFGISQIEINTEVFPDGSTVEIELTGSNLPSILRGCILDAGTLLQNGQAFADYLAGIFIASAAALASAPTATVNIAVTITTPSGEDSESDFVPIQLLGVGIIPPEDQEVTVDPGDPMFTPSPIGLEFQTVGIPSGTEVTFDVFDDSLGVVTPTTSAVVSDLAFTQYIPNNVLGGNLVTATLVLPNPSDFDPDCPNVPVADRTAQASVVITQSAPQPTPAPTPTPGP